VVRLLAAEDRLKRVALGRCQTLADTFADRGAGVSGPDNPAERLAIAEELRQWHALRGRISWH
jgi:hypothetical protein